jgi:hypothetical protein
MAKGCALIVTVNTGNRDVAITKSLNTGKRRRCAIKIVKGQKGIRDDEQGKRDITFVMTLNMAKGTLR